MDVAKATEFKNLGNQAFTAGKFEEAIQHFTKAIELNPNDHVFYSNRSGCFASLKQYDKAYDDAKKCVELKPDWGKGYARKGLAEFYLDKLDDAISTYEAGLKLDPANAQLKEGLERAKEEKENREEAQTNMNNPLIQNLMKSVMTNPKTRHYLNDKDFMTKLNLLQQNPNMLQFLLQDPKFQEVFGLMFSEGAPEEAAGSKMEEEAPHTHTESHSHSHKEEHHGHTHTHSSHEHHSHTHESHSHQQTTHSHSHTTSTRMQEEKKTSSSSLSEADQEKAKGNEEYTKRNFDAAIQHYNRAIELNPLELIYYFNKAAVYQERKEYQEVIKIVDEAFKVAEENNIKDFAKLAKLYSRKGNAYTGLEDYDQALFWLDKSLVEDNQQKVKDERRRVEKLKKDREELAYQNPELGEKARERGNEFFKNGDYPNAVKEYDEAVRRNPKDSKAFNNKATCLTKLGDIPGALKAVERAVEIDPTFVKAWAKKGSIHQTLSEFHKAMEAYEKGLKIDPENVECKEGLSKVQFAVMYGGGQGNQEERAKKAMADPEIQAILRTPEIINLLKDMEQRPNAPEIAAALRNPDIAKKLEKLVAAGVLKMG
eukprot:TRINITY_DN1485_c0_g1_i5.p1 TRINITY_DN1485_c0_g1~~TRINITY_DN1485_c0_g1_i5.p1  ORF type:complete len:597 (-),score=229.01 TRINITY_DN1485_c0_g1_i5:177-1967(-)